MNGASTAANPPSVLMRPAEAISIKQAVAHSGKSEKTIRRLCSRYGLARQTFPFAPLEISLVGLEMALQGDAAAIELLRAGLRSDPVVRRYLDHLGIAPE